MTQMLTIDELEKEIAYLRKQNQKLIQEFSLMVKENTALREELALKRKQYGGMATRTTREQRKIEDPQPSEGEKADGMFWFN